MGEKSPGGRGEGEGNTGIAEKGAGVLGGQQCGKGAARLQKTSQEGLHREKRLEKLEANEV